MENKYICRTQIAWDAAQKLAKRRIEREQGRNDAADDLSELSEGEKEKGDGNVLEFVKDHSFARINSELQMWSDHDNKSRHLYIVLIRSPYLLVINCTHPFLLCFPFQIDKLVRFFHSIN